MPIIYTYPSATPASGDLLLISDISETEPENATRTCTVGDIVSLVGALVPGGGTVTSVGLQAGTTGLSIATTTTNPITTTGTFTVGGTLVVSNGGTGQVALDPGFALFGTGTGAVSPLDVTAKGTLIAGDGTTDVDTKTLAVSGNNNYVLAENSAASNGLEWKDLGTLAPESFQVDAATLPGLTPTAATVGTVTLAGNLQVGGGGTGQTSLTQHAFVVGNTASAVQTIGPLTNGQLLIGSTSAAPNPATLTGGTNITIDNSVAGQITINAAASGSMSSFTLAGDGGPSQTISDSNTLTIAGGTGVTTAASATDTITITADTLSKTDAYTGLGLKGSGSGSFTPSTNLAAYWTSGDYVYVEFYMAWLIAEGTSIVGNLILTGLPVAAYQTGVLDNGNCIIHVNTDLGSSASLQAPTTGWVGLSGVTTEMTFRFHNANGVLADYPYTNKDGDASSYALGGTIRYLQTVA